MVLIHILDKQTDEIIGTLNTEKGEVNEPIRTSSLDNQNTFDMVAFKKFDLLTKRNRLLASDRDGFYHEYIIFYANQYKRSEKIVKSDASFVDLAKAKVIDPQTLQGATSATATEFALLGTEWQPGDIEYTFIRTIEIEKHTDPYSLLKLIASTFELEIRFRVEINGNKVTRYVDMKKQIAGFEGKEIRFGKDLIGIERVEDANKIVTALLGIGPEREDGTRLTVFVEDNDALQRWGRKGQHLIEVYEPESSDQDMTADRLRTLTENALKKRIDAIVSYKCTAASLEHIFGRSHEKIRLGQTVRIKDDGYTPPLYVEARIQKTIENVALQQVIDFEIGNFIEYKKEDLEAQITSLKKVINDKIANMVLSTVTTSAGDTFKNGAGTTTLTAKVFLGGAETDLDGTRYTYKWTKRDKDGNLVSGYSKTTKSITVTAAEITEKATFVVEISTDKVLSVSQITITNVYDGTDGAPGPAGSDAKLLYLSNTADVMTFTATGTPDPATQTITFTANLQNITGTAAFTVTPYDGTGKALTAITLGGTGNTRTLTQAQWPATAVRVVVTATLSGLTGTVTITQLKAGAKGDIGTSGKDAIVGFLTNESITLGADSTGNVGDFSKATGTFEVYEGIGKKTGTVVTYAKTAESGCTVSINTSGVYSVTTMSADTATATFTATYGEVTITKVLSLAKSKTGAIGLQGPAGKDGIAYAGTTAPSNPATNSTWFQTDAAGNVVAIKKWSGSEWITSPMTQDALSVTKLSALSADLGNVTAGEMSGVSLKLGVGGNGELYVMDGDNIIGRIDANGAYFPLIQGDNIVGNVVNKYKRNANDVIFFDVDNGNDANNGLASTSPKKGLQQFIDNLPKDLNGSTITLRCKGSQSGQLTIEGFRKGRLQIAGWNTTNVLNTNAISVNYCDRVLIQDTTVWGLGGTSPMIQANYCGEFYATGVLCYGGTSQSHAFWMTGSKFVLSGCQAYKIIDRCLYAGMNSQGVLINGKGNPTVAVLSEDGSIVNGYGSRWGGSLVARNGGAINVASDTWSVVDTGAGSTPTPPPIDQTLSVTPTTGDNYSSQGFWTNDEVKQGNLGYGDRYGLWYFDLSAIKGKQILSATITVNRLAGGTNAARTIYFRTHRVTSRGARPAGAPAMSAVGATGSLAVGATGTFDITSMVQSNIASGVDTSIGIHTTGSTDYMSLGTQPTLNIRYK